MNFLTEVKGFTPVIDALARETSLVTAAVYGIVWRYCQQKNKVCYASLDTMAEHIGIDERTVRRHLKELCDLGYLLNCNPDEQGTTHVYQDTGKAKIIGLVEATIDNTPDTESTPPRTESPTKRVYEESNGNTQPSVVDSAAKPAPPVMIDGWIDMVQKTKNKNAVLRYMYQCLYPDHDVPDFGYVGKTAKRVGGSARLAQLLWIACGYRPTGDVLRYVQTMWKDKKNGSNFGSAEKTEPKRVVCATGIGERIGHLTEAELDARFGVLDDWGGAGAGSGGAPRPA